jgi:hypothetical protein
LCRNCLIKTAIEGKTQGRTEMIGSWGRKMSAAIVWH